MAGLVQEDPVPQRGWQLQDLGPAGVDNDPLSATYSPLVSPGSGDEGPSPIPGERGETDPAVSVLMSSGDSALNPSQKARTPASIVLVNFLTMPHPHSVSWGLLGIAPPLPSAACCTGFSRSQHFCGDVVIKPDKLSFCYTRHGTFTMCCTVSMALHM